MEYPGNSGWQVGIWFHDENGDPDEARVPTREQQKEALEAIGGKLDEFLDEDLVTLATLPEDMARECWYGGYAIRNAKLSEGTVSVEVEMP